MYHSRNLLLSVSQSLQISFLPSHGTTGLTEDANNHSINSRNRTQQPSLDHDNKRCPQARRSDWPGSHYTTVAVDLLEIGLSLYTHFQHFSDTILDASTTLSFAALVRKDHGMFSAKLSSVELYGPVDLTRNSTPIFLIHRIPGAPP